MTGRETRFRDRREAGRVLARLLGGYAGRNDVVVLALPRGGVPGAYEVAKALAAPLDVFVVRKLGVPGHRELAMGRSQAAVRSSSTPAATSTLCTPQPGPDLTALEHRRPSPTSV